MCCVCYIQVLGYGWAGILRKYVVEPAHMWWPGTLVQVSLFRSVFPSPPYQHYTLKAKYGIMPVREDKCVS